MIHFEIEGKPQPKQRPRFAKGKVYTPKQTSDYEKLVAWSYKAKQGKPIEGAVGVFITIYVKIPKSRKDLRFGSYHTQRGDLGMSDFNKEEMTRFIEVLMDYAVQNGIDVSGYER